MKPRTFIDGAAGTPGLQIRQRLEGRTDLAVVSLSGSERKESGARTRALNESDLSVLCVPDQAAREAVVLIENSAVRVLDASTAHRTSAGWVYGFAELEPGRRGEIAAAQHVSNPGCYSTGFLALMRPLVREGIVPADFPLSANAVSGYSGGGKAMIEEFESAAPAGSTKPVIRTYALTLAHKHVPEMQVHAGLNHPPVFAPSVGRYYRGMIVEVPLQLWALPGNTSVPTIHAVFADAYAGQPLVHVEPLAHPADTATLDALRHHYGLDQPLYVQYVSWIVNALQGDLGVSFEYRAPVATITVAALTRRPSVR